MSQTVDSRVVEMRFDNKQFEAGAKQTMGTLGKLKEALKLPETGKALEGIDKATKGIKLDGIAAGVEALERRFSTLGIVGMRVIENITDGLMSKLHAAVSFVTDAIVSGGIKRAMNIENAHFQLQALLKDETKVQAVMADAMESVDGTAYAYDEAAKAASQFAASGIQAGDEMLNALKGITGVAAMTNSSFEDVSRIFTTVAGNGRLMGDQLLQLSSRGLNAASTIADYFREVRGQTGMTEASIREMVSKGQISFKDFSDAMTWAFGDSAKRANETFTGAMSNMKSALARIGAGFVSPLVEQNGELVQLFNALRIKINDVKSALVFDEQRSAISGLADATEMTKDELTEMFKIIKANGKVSISDLDNLTKKGANATEALTKYVNGVTDGSIRASYAISSALGDLTKGTKVSSADIRRFVEEGKIDLSTFTAAMEKEFGTEKTLSKQFTDWFQDHVHSIVEAINSADMTKPMEIFYYWVESVKNVAKGLLSVLGPVGKAFADVFFSFDADDVISFSDAVEKLTSKMKLSERGSKNLHDAFQGLFSLLKLGIDIFFGLLGAIIPINKPVVEMGDGFLGLAGSMGRSLTFFTKMIRSCTLLRRGFSILTTGFSMGMDGLSKLIKIGNNFIRVLSGMEGTTKLINAVSKAFEKLGLKVSPYIEGFLNEAEHLVKTLFSFEEISLDDVLNNISNAFADLAWEIEHFSFKTIDKGFDVLKQKIKAISDLAMSNESFATFVKNFKKFGEELKEAFTLDNLLDRLEKVMDIFERFFNWIKSTMAPAFKDFNVGSAIAAGAGIGIIRALLKAVKLFDKVTGPFTSFKELLGTVKGTLVAYQKDLKADMLLKIAGAIGILAVSITILSFADMENAWQAAIMLGLIGAALVTAVGYFTDVVKKTKTVNDATFMLAKAANNLAKRLKWKAIGSAVKDFAKSIAVVALSIIGLGIMYTKNQEGFIAGSIAVGVIAASFTAIIAIFAALGKRINTGIENFEKVAKSAIMLSLSVGIIVGALNKLFKMSLPEDYGVKLAILAGLMTGVGVLAIVLGLAGKIAGGGSSSLLKEMKLPSGLKWAEGIMKSSNGGSLNAAPILAIAGSLYIIVGALNKLFKMSLPEDSGAKLAILALLMVELGGLMIAMAYASKLAGGAIKATGAILSMTAFIAVVVAALFVLTLIPVNKMLAGATGLGLVLISLGIALAGAGQVSDKNTWKSVLAMAITVGAITAALAVLSMVPFEKLIKATASLGIILYALKKDFEALAKGNFKDSFPLIITMLGLVTVIAYSLYVLAEQPWENLLSGAIGLSGVLLALAGSFGIISKIKPDIGLITAFSLASSLLVGIISVSIYKLAEQPWENLLAAAGSLALVLISLTGCLSILTAVGANIGTAAQAALALGAFIGILAGVITILGVLFTQDILPLEGYLDKGIEILVKIGNGLGRFVGSIVEGALTQISNALPTIGDNLSSFWQSGSLFFYGIAGVPEEAFKKIAELSLALLVLTAAELVSGILSFGGIGFAKLGLELSAFMTAAGPFFAGLNGVDAETLSSVQNIGSMILALTASNILQGVAAFFGIRGGFSSFAEELVAFGPAISEFAETVKDVKPEAVQGAASAAEIMATTASKLQGHGGIIQEIMGEKSLAAFAEELVAFGPAISEFAETVKDVKPEAVQGAASAAEIMATVAEKLPNQGGLAAKILGDNTLSQFGEELVKFGPKIVAFSNFVKDVKPEAVQGAASAAEIMANLANTLPEGDTLWSKIFGGGQVTLSQFGEELVKFGASMSSFSSSVSGINVEQINNAITSFKELVDLSSYVQDKSSEGFKEFVDRLEEIGGEGLNAFCEVFANSSTDVKSAFDAFYVTAKTSITDGFKELESMMETNGANIVDGLIRGMESKSKSLKSSAVNLASVIDGAFTKYMKIKSPSRLMRTRGEQVDSGLETGIKENSDGPIEATEAMAEDINEIIEDKIIDETSAKKVEDSYDRLLEVVSRAQKEYKELEEESDNNSNLRDTKRKKQSNDRLKSETEFWQDLYVIKKNGQDKDKKQDLDFSTFQKNTLQETINVLKEYLDKLKSTRDSFMSGDLFAEVSEKSAKSKDEIKKNLNDQIRELEEYANVLTSLNVRLEGTNLLNYIQTLGVDSVEQLKVLNSMTDSELSEYATLYDVKMAAATNAASAQLSTLQEETERKLENVFGVMTNSVNLQDFVSVFDGSLQSIGEYVTNFVKPIEEAALEAGKAGQNLSEAVVDGIQTGFENSDIGSSIATSIGTSMTEIVQDQGENAKTVGNKIGGFLTSGIGEGMIGDSSFIDASKEVIFKVVDSLQSAGEINSPSALTEREVGTYLTQGIGKGMLNGVEELSSVSSEIVNAITESLLLEMKSIPETLTSGVSLDSFRSIGESMSNELANGIKMNPQIEASIDSLLSDILIKFSGKNPDFSSTGIESINQYLSGIKSTYEIAESTGLALVNKVLAGIQNSYSSFYNAGANAGQGFVDGVKSKLDGASSVGKELAEAAYKAAMKALDEHSPSKKMGEVGDNAGLGFINSLMLYVSKAAKIGEDLGEATISSASGTVKNMGDLILSDINDNMVITPSIDLKNVQESVSYMRQLFNDAVNQLDTNAQNVSVGISNRRSENDQAIEQKRGKMEGDTYNFIQNNNSPKALSRIEIYRQTRNQFSQFKEAMDRS